MAGLILALDILDPQKAMKILQKVSEYIDYVKIGWPLVMNGGMNIVRESSKIKPVICDFKVADIPNTTRLIVSMAKKYNASGVIVHAFVGRDSIRAAVEEALGMDVFVVTEMSHPGALDFMQKHAEEMVKMAKEEGARGIIAPATRPERLRKLKEIAGDMLILSPGVGAQGGKARDAVEAGADYIIVGRSIYNAPNPREEAKELKEIISQI